MSIEETPAGDAGRAALTALIDYAGVFPPARLTLADALAQYRDARVGERSWVLRRFACPHSGLTELVGLLPEDDSRLPVVAAVDDDDPTAFSLTASHIAWRSFRAGADDVARLRNELFTSFGSCSFAGPIAGLEALGILPAPSQHAPAC